MLLLLLFVIELPPLDPKKKTRYKIPTKPNSQGKTPTIYATHSTTVHLFSIFVFLFRIWNKCKNERTKETSRIYNALLQVYRIYIFLFKDSIYGRTCCKHLHRLWYFRRVRKTHNSSILSAGCAKKENYIYVFKIFFFLYATKSVFTVVTPSVVNCNVCSRLEECVLEQWQINVNKKSGFVVSWQLVILWKESHKKR